MIFCRRSRFVSKVLRPDFDNTTKQPRVWVFLVFLFIKYSSVAVYSLTYSIIPKLCVTKSWVVASPIPAPLRRTSSSRDLRKSRPDVYLRYSSSRENSDSNRNTRFLVIL